MVKTRIVKLMKEGVNLFQVDRVMVVNPDWSRKSVGFAKIL